MRKIAKTAKDLKKYVPKIKVKGVATYRKKKRGNYLVLLYKDIHGKYRQLLVPASDANDLKKIKKELIDNGLPHTTSDTDWIALQKLLFQAAEANYELVENPGFYDTVYLQPDNKVIGTIKEGAKQPILDPARKAPLPLIEKKGALKGWQQNVASAALHSSRIMLSLSATFSAYILVWADIENGGFHLFGPSSMGKSTCLFISVSVRSGPDGMESWSVTNTGVEELAAAHNDKTLTLDESGKLDSDPIKAAQRAGTIIYTLASGKDKCRSTSYSSERLTWRVICLSSGEKSLIETANDAGVQKMLGEEVRLVDVPADAGFGIGIYESLPNGLASSEYADALQEYVKKDYGVAETAFLKCITEDLEKSGVDKIKEKIKAAMQEFLEYINIDKRSKGFEIRLAKRFALAYAGGKLAADYGILPFEDCKVIAGVSRCYQDTIAHRPQSFQDQVKKATATLMTELENSSIFLDVRRPNHGKSTDEIDKAKGFHASFKDEAVRAIRPAYVKKLIQDDKVRSAVLNNLKKTGRLKTDADGKSTIQLRSHLKSPKALPRCYCFTRK